MLSSLHFLMIPKKRKEELKFMAKLFAVAAYMDEVVRYEEVKEIDKIEHKEHLEDFESKYVDNKIDSLIAQYQADKSIFDRDREYVLEEIISGRKNIRYAKYIIDIFKSDFEISKEERMAIEKLESIIEALDYLNNFYEKKWKSSESKHKD